MKSEKMDMPDIMSLIAYGFGGLTAIVFGLSICIVEPLTFKNVLFSALAFAFAFFGFYVVWSNLKEQRQREAFERK